MHINNNYMFETTSNYYLLSSNIISPQVSLVTGIPRLTIPERGRRHSEAKQVVWTVLASLLDATNSHNPLICDTRLMIDSSGEICRDRPGLHSFGILNMLGRPFVCVV
jgi:hypothetical protein